MKISITSRGHTLSDVLHEYVEERVKRLEKYVHGEEEVHVVLERGTEGQIVELTFHGFNKTLHSRETDETVRSCVDKAVAKLEAQVRKLKDKITDKRK